MTPDMKRLCKAAWKAEGVSPHADHLHDPDLADACDADRERVEAIVRAVLMELRSNSLSAYEAAAAELDDPFDQYGRVHAETVGMYVGELIDHILDTKARRDKALSELAEIDRDLI